MLNEKMEKIIFLTVFILCFAMTIFGQNASEKVQKAADFFASAYNANNYAQIEAQFNVGMKSAVPPEKLAKFLDDLRADSGKITKLGTPNFTAPTAANFPADFERRKWILSITLDAEGKIAGFQITPPPSGKPKTLRAIRRN